MRARERSARTNRSLASLARPQPFLSKATREGGRHCRVRVLQGLGSTKSATSCFQQPWLRPSLQKPEQLAVTIKEPFQGIHGGFKVADANIVRAAQLADGQTKLFSKRVRTAMREEPNNCQLGNQISLCPNILVTRKYQKGRLP